ncbi:MAG: NTP transferase domain-containing protein [Tepidisphaeraceae bacterium]
MNLSAIILAAGKSTRMKSRRPKVLHEICGRPMLDYVLRACYDAGCSRVFVVVGYGKDEVVAQFGADERITWIEQIEQLGTGHAAKMCEKHVRQAGGDALILAGDGPLVRGDVLMTLVRAHHDDKAAASMATAVLDDPTGYGRVVRDKAGEFVEIVEELDASAKQRAIREVFPSLYCVRSEDLLSALSKLSNKNRKGEFYLTDIYGILRKGGRKIVAVQAASAEDVIGINTRQHLADVDAIMQDRIQRELRESGVTIVSGVNTYIESGTTIGPDSVVYPFTFIGRDSTIGADCAIGPFATLPRNSIVPEGTTISGNVSIDNALTTGSGA